MKQLSFSDFDQNVQKSFGGSLLKGNPRSKRPITTKKPMHLVLRSSYAKGRYSFQNQRLKNKIENIIRKLSKKSGVKIYRFANSGNHLHSSILGCTSIY